MSGSTKTSSDEPALHPRLLQEADRAYLVRWGSREMLLSGAMALASTAGILHLAYWHSPYWAALLLPVLPLGGLLILFFRNPRRQVPDGPGLMVAPADGTVVEVEPVEEPEYLEGEALKVSIFLSILNVHVNRAPASGQVEYVRHRPGRHLDARSSRCSRENESQAVGIRLDERESTPGLKILMRQISGAIARRIVCPLATGHAVTRGGLVGMIKYGSRTELFVPSVPAGKVLRVLVQVGDRVVGGETVIFRVETVER
ncbi:MAG: phosphatidylserine decarboxylase [Planctomycetota bacterium]|nr:phosphatidylserine decarboxylase [Planctomycetota bacterium]